MFVSVCSIYPEADLMIKMVFRIIFLFYLCVVVNAIQWKSYEEGIQEIEEKNKPGIVLIHYSTCPACIHVKNIMESSEKIEKLSEKFVMISCENGKEPRDITYKGGTI